MGQANLKTFFQTASQLRTFSPYLQKNTLVRMHGTLNEIDIRSMFQLVELGQRTGTCYEYQFHLECHAF